MSEFHIIIPARYNSVRFPGKLLHYINDKTVLELTYRQALKAGALTVTIATDNQDIFGVATKMGADVVMTDEAHQSGTDRIAEAARMLGLTGEQVIVNVQGDEPFIKPELIRQVASLVCDAPMATLCWPIEELSQLQNPNTVKVIRDKNQQAMYFSRAPIPHHRDDNNHMQWLRHIGLYAYRADFLQQFTELEHCELEHAECLEQLRALYHGFSITVATALSQPLSDINTRQDLEELTP